QDAWTSSPCTAAAATYALSLHDALPICAVLGLGSGGRWRRPGAGEGRTLATPEARGERKPGAAWRLSVKMHSPEPVRSYTTHRRSEEHTSELQSRFDLVCRLLLEKKKI